jgi:hypothetical protein
MASKILILNDPGLTAYDPQIGRNLTNELSTEKLTDLGLPKEYIEPVSMKGFFWNPV